MLEFDKEVHVLPPGRLPVSLRVPRWGDTAYIRWLWSDPTTMAAVGGPIILTDDQAKHWFERMVQPGSATDHYCLILTGANGPVGEISYHRLDKSTMTADFKHQDCQPRPGTGLCQGGHGLVSGGFLYPSAGAGSGG
jgi:hypothetical protein